MFFKYIGVLLRIKLVVSFRPSPFEKPLSSPLIHSLPNSLLIRHNMNPHEGPIALLSEAVSDVYSAMRETLDECENLVGAGVGPQEHLASLYAGLMNLSEVFGRHARHIRENGRSSKRA